jgi:hypothetical protein
MNTIPDDCKMTAAEELRDILAEADNITTYKVDDLPGGATVYFGGCQQVGSITKPTPEIRLEAGKFVNYVKVPATQTTPAKAPATDNTGSD